MRYIYFLGLLSIIHLNTYSQTIRVPKPDTMSSVVSYELYPSKVFIPVMIHQNVIKSAIDKATPLSFQVKDYGNTQEFDMSFNLIDGQSDFSGNSITHHVRLKNGDGHLSRRGYTNLPWPFNGRVYSPWLRVDCDDIRGNLKASISATLQSDYRVSTSGKLDAKIDNLQCAQINVTGIVRAFGWHTLEMDINKNIANELNKFDFRKIMLDKWSTLQKPLRVANDFFILGDPKEVTYSDFFFKDQFLYAGLGLKFLLTTGDTLEANNWKPTTPLPNLSKDYIDSSGITLNLPIKVSYKALQSVTKKVMIDKIIRGKLLSEKEKDFAKIKDIEISGGIEQGYDIIIGIKANVLTTIYKKENVNIFLHASFKYDTTNKELYVEKYMVDLKTKNALYNTSLETLSNEIFYKRILSNLKFKIGEAAEKQKAIANKLLSKKIEISKGVTLNGLVNTIELKKIVTLPDKLICVFNLKGNANIEIIKF